MSAHREILLGAHVSTAGGLEQAIINGEEFGCSAIQFFTHSNRQWHIKPLSQQDIALFKEYAQKSTVKSYVVHASYLINLASPSATTRHQSIQALVSEMDRCNALGIPTLVLHPGSATDKDTEAGVARLAESLDEACTKAGGHVRIALEIMAGQGSSLGGSLEQLAQIKKACSHSARIQFCLDTCHAFAAGYTFATKSEYAQFKSTIESTIGIKHIAVIHMNDSAKLAGSHVDRHAHIGEGHIPIEAFTHIMNDKDFVDVPKILETPHEPEGSDKKNMATLLSLCR